MKKRKRNKKYRSQRVVINKHIKKHNPNAAQNITVYRKEL